MRFALRTTLPASLAVVALGLVLLGAGCAQSGSSASASGATGGQALFESKCSVCHGLERPNSVKKDRAGWVATVDRMRSHGALVDDAQAAAIVDYLVKRDGGQ